MRIPWERLSRIVFFAYIAIGISYLGLWWIAAAQNLTWRADFTAFYTAAAVVRDGLGDMLYDLDLQARYQTQILGGRYLADGLLAFYYPPYVALFFYPFSYLSLSVAYGLWAAVQLGLLSWFLYSLWKFTESQGWISRARKLLLASVVAVPSLMFTYLLGAVSLFSALCLLQFFWALKENRNIDVGLWLVLGSVKPQVFFLPLLVLLAIRLWRALGDALLIGVPLVLLSTLSLGWPVWWDFVRTVFLTSDRVGSIGVEPSAMYNLRGTLMFWLDSQYGKSAGLVSWIFFFLTCVVTVFIWYALTKAERNAAFDLAAAMTILLGTLFGVHVNPQDGLFLVVALLFFYNYLQRSDRTTLAINMVFLSCPFLWLVGHYGVGDVLRIRIPVLLMLFFAVWMGKLWYTDVMKPQTGGAL